MPIDLSAPGVAKLVAERIKKDIDAYCIQTYSDAHRNHLGASLIGRECPADLWFTFRWASNSLGNRDVETQARMLRLFNRGHREEERFIEFLRGIGCTVETHTEDGQQYRVVGVHGHFGGSQDASATLPAHYEINEKVLCEFKTNGTGRAFEKLKEDGAILAKKDHFAQMSVYGAKRGYRFCLYLNINKNDDDLHVELVPLDLKLAAQLEIRAQHIITERVRPPRVSESPSFWLCKFCDHKEVCHEKKPMQKNCRSCVNSYPAEGATWTCALYQQTIPQDFIKLGCDNWKQIV